MRFVDANVLLRYLTRDDEAKAAACRVFLMELEAGLDDAATSEVVVAEVMHVLTSRQWYGWDPADAAALVSALIAIPALRIPQKPICLEALAILERHPHLLFEDAYSVAYMEASGIAEIVSYDRDFDRVPEVVRVEP